MNIHGKLVLSWVILLGVLLVSSSSSNHIGIDRIVVETDMGADDIMAITMLLQYCSRPKSLCSVEALIGARGLQGTAHNASKAAKRLLNKLQEEESELGTSVRKVRVFDGAEIPLSNDAVDRRFSDSFVVSSVSMLNRLGFPQLGRSWQPESLDDALSFLSALSIEGDSNLIMIALSPPTVLASAALEPQFLKRAIPLDVFFMGGGIFQIADGTPNNASEWNVYLDPLATDKIFSATQQKAVFVSMIGLDVTGQVSVSQVLTRLNQDSNDPTKKITVAGKVITSALITLQSADSAWDAIAAFRYLSPSSFTQTSTLHVRVILDGDESGETIVDPACSNLVEVPLSIVASSFIDWVSASSFVAADNEANT